MMSKILEFMNIHPILSFIIFLLICYVLLNVLVFVDAVVSCVIGRVCMYEEFANDDSSKLSIYTLLFAIGILIMAIPGYYAYDVIMRTYNKFRSNCNQEE